MPKILVFIFLSFTVYLAQGQRKSGSWQDYLSYSAASKIAISQNRVYCATEGGIFFLDTEDNSVQKFSGMVQLSDFGIKTMAYSAQNKVLVVAYNNSNIDLVYSNKVVNLSDIKRKQITADKAINNITFIGNEALLSCGFGIVVITLGRDEIKDTYLLGDEGAMLAVNDVETDGSMLFAATDEGILKAPLQGANLLDFRSWQRDEKIPYYTEKFNFLAYHGGSIIANYTPDEYSGDKMYKFNGNDWDLYLPQVQFLFDLQTNGDHLVATGRTEVFLVDSKNEVIAYLNSYQLGDEQIKPIQPRSSGVSASGAWYIADAENAMIQVSGNNFEQIFPNGPINNQMFALTANASDLWIAAGGRTGSWNNTFTMPLFQNLRNGEWTYFNNSNRDELEGFFDVVKVLADPADPDHFFVASWGGGVLEYRGNEFVNRFTNKNSPLQSALPQQPDEPYVRIGGMDFDSQGNLWIANSSVAKNLLKLSPQGEWESFALPEVANGYMIGDVLVTQNDDKWIIVPRGHDAYVVDRDGQRKKRLTITSYFNNGDQEFRTRMNDVYALAEDREGAIWVGTSKGVAVYGNPSRIWESEDFLAAQPSLDLNDGLYHPLLETETVTAIAVDGANRKWLGTMNSGVFLVNENGDREILHFTETNSPLLSNTISSISINPKSGEVFIGTDEGLVSYMGEATGGEDSYANVYVYPNPVRETYDGPITVVGLIENSEVKITDIGGNLVFRTQSLGGQAIWNGRNLNGKRVKTGVYLVFCNDELGEETHIEKLLFIH